ncbi:unnamed protein product [Agarophyton chilense]
MVQFVAVQCFRCHQLQVSQRRRDSRFVCKLCGARQSLRKVFASSMRAAELRPFVQKRNLARGLAAERYDDEYPPELQSEPEPEPECDADADVGADAGRERDAQHCCEVPAAFRPCSQLPSRWRSRAAAVECAIAAPSPEEAQLSEDDVVTALPDAARGRQCGRKRAFRKRTPNNPSLTALKDERPTSRRRTSAPYALVSKPPVADSKQFFDEGIVTRPDDEEYQEEVWS